MSDPSDVQRVMLICGAGEIALAIAARCESAGHRVVTSTEALDVASVDSLVSGTVDQCGGIDGLIVVTGAQLGDGDSTNEAIIRAGLLIPLMLATRANVEMQRAGSGLIVNVIESVDRGEAAEREAGSVGAVAAGAARAGLLSLTRSLTIEWGPALRLASIVCDRGVTLHDVAEACCWLVSSSGSSRSGPAITL